MTLKGSKISIVLATFILVVNRVLSASTPVTWVSDPRFVAGTFVYVPSTTGAIMEEAVIVPYGMVMSGVSRSVAMGLVNFDFKFNTVDFIFNVKTNRVGTNAFQFNVTTASGSDIQELKISYLTVDAAFTSPFSIAYFERVYATPIQGPFDLTYNVNFTVATGVVLNLANSNAMLAFQHIMDFNSPTKCFHIDIVFQVISEYLYQVVVSTSCDLQLYAVGFSRIIFDKTEIQALGQCFFEFGQVSSTNGNDPPLRFSTTPFFSNNFMFGLKSYNARGSDKIQFRTTIASNTRVNSGFNFVSISFMYWSFKKRECPAGYPFFQISTLLCYDVCPDGTYPDTILDICPLCHYSCLTCSAYDVCTNCDPATNRFQNGSTCSPNSGYFDNGTSDAVACSLSLSNCLECINSSICTNCTTGFYADINGTCQPCDPTISSCLECQYITGNLQCTNCSAGFSLSADGLSCDTSLCSDPNCIDCTGNSSVCQTCATGYQANITCIAVCGDGIIVGGQQCDDSNLINGDGCSSNCTNETTACSSGTPYLSPITNTCVSSCPNLYYNQPSNFTCISCFYTCLTCTDGTSCTGCQPSSNRVLNVNNFDPQPGYFDNGTRDALICVSPCNTCSSLSTCLTCITGYYLNGANCVPCSNPMPFCAQCDVAGSTCLLCQAGYSFNTTTNNCQMDPCSDINCINCPNSINQCTQCLAGFSVSGGSCIPVCGDFITISNQACDDGNTRDKDGCSSNCNIQTDFECQTTANNDTGSQCYFIGELKIQQVYINKIEGQNKIQIVLDLSPKDLVVWDEINFMDMIEMNSPVPITGYQVIKNEDGTVKIILQYAQDIQGQAIDININPNNTGHPSFLRTPQVQKNLVIIPDNNQAALFYDQSVYNMANIVSVLCSVISVASSVFLIVGLVSGKMIGVQMMAVIQISFFSLITLSQVNPCFAALSNLRFINGYNLKSNHLQDPLTPAEPKGLFLLSRFGQNFNLTIIVVLLPLLIALIAFILSKTVFKENEKVLNVAKRAVGQYTLMGLLFGGYIISVSFALQMMFGLKKTDDFIGGVSVAESILLLLLFVGYFVFLLLKPNFFGEFTQSFRKDKFPQKYYNIMLIERLLVGSCLIFLISSGIGAVVPLVVFIILGAIVLIKKPYKETYNNYRVIANMSISIAVQAIYLSYSKVPQQQKKSNPVFLYLPFIVIACLFVCVIYNSIAIIYSLIKFIKGQNAKEEELNEQKDELSKLRNLSIYIPTGSPTSLKSPLSSPISMRQETMSPLSLRKKLTLDDMKKDMVKVNPEKGQMGIVNQMLMQRNVPINESMKKVYDQI